MCTCQRSLLWYVQSILLISSVQAQSDHLCNTLLDVMSSIYCQDMTNYFLLEPHHSLSIFASVITEKSKGVQVCIVKEPSLVLCLCLTIGLFDKVVWIA